ncbi:hypothetical protein CDO52_10810 [Nocardiopsis gilva YIM 90087]|uniref:Secreted protein n=1 Tax=Nocardiopsis gilva YIM 90087 TaxID=1235441 RepID=A0A223S514_9ACTN|nr:hypothetical protein [Nocardiopsis gilva]ASU83201.1 hypothetical protein CDO52_10810 [Nocardiopsis gilva YIM 90087]
MATTKLILTATLATAAIAIAGLSAGTAHADTLTSVVGGGESIAGTTANHKVTPNKATHTLEDTVPLNNSLIDNVDLKDAEAIDTEDMISPNVRIAGME